MSDELKPTNKQISDYIMMWIESFGGDGLILVDDDPIKEALEQTDFSILREMFDPTMYNSIDEWAKDN